MTENQWVNSTKAAKLIGISRDMLLYYCRNGRGPKSEYIAGHWVFRPDDIKGWEPKKLDSGRPPKASK